MRRQIQIQVMICVYLQIVYLVEPLLNVVTILLLVQDPRCCLVGR